MKLFCSTLLEHFDPLVVQLMSGIVWNLIISLKISIREFLNGSFSFDENSRTSPGETNT